MPDDREPGTLIWAVLFGTPALLELVAGLNEQNARIVLIGDVGAAPPPLLSIIVEGGDRHALAAAFVQARDRLGVPDLVIHASIDPASLQPAGLDSLSAEDWNRQAQIPLRQTLHVLQDLLPYLEHHGGSVVVLGPSLSQIGAAGLATLTSVIEAQRGLMKSAARQWGARGIRLNWLSLAPQSFAPTLANVELPLGPELGPPPLPLGRRPDLRRDAAKLLLLLASPAASALIGATLNLDGGEWMLP